VSRPFKQPPAPARPAPATPAPERDLELALRSVTGHWGPWRFSGPARLRLTSDALVLDSPHGESFHAAYGDLTGAGWRTDSLVIHGDAGRIQMEAEGAGADRLGVALVTRACPLPELTRSHRRLGSRRGGAPEAQYRFLAPLLQARRRMEDELEPERRIAALDGPALRTRLRDGIESLAQEAYPHSAPDRRGLTVELQEATMGLFGGIARLEEAAQRFTQSDEATRFVAWRAWLDSAIALFRQADSSWVAVARLLPERSQR
jgi:hypothetical protein